MMYQTLRLFSFLIFVTAACGAPTPLDAATLLQNGEEAQALNRFFRSLKASDPCKDGQVACLAGKTIARCRGTLWETTLDSCSKSESCFALPSVSSSGTRLACTSEKSAENLISATGATGGILGNPNNSTIKVYNGGATEDGTDESSSTQVMNANTPAYATATAAGVSGSKPDNSPVNNINGGDTVAAVSPPCTKAGATPSQITPTATANSSPPSYTDPSPASAPAATSAIPQQVTVTVTLVPSQPTTLAPQTRTLSPEDASSIIASIEATTEPTVAPETPSYNTPAPAPTSAQAAADDAQISSSTSAAVASPSPSPASQENNTGYY